MERQVFEKALKNSTSFSKEQANACIKILKKWWWSSEKKYLALAKIVNNING